MIHVINMFESNKFYFVGGLSGTGKTALLKVMHELYPNFFDVISGSSYFMSWLGLAEGDYASLQTLPIDYKNHELGKMMRSVIHNSRKSGIVLFDGHYLRIHDGLVTTAVGDWIAHVDGIIHINAPISDMIERLGRESERPRAIFPRMASDEEKCELLQKWSRLSQEEASKFSNYYGLPLITLMNHRGELEQTAEKFSKILLSNQVVRV